MGYDRMVREHSSIVGTRRRYKTKRGRQCGQLQTSTIQYVGGGRVVVLFPIV